ncbi:hypothetical protein CAOG_07558 [Capsaspora owczarzaki ATCC 30864]|uniref:TFIIS N-terminal domain-containing protein n=1 Tax=Capsaspora owczarzaki (strain ATCC 30864) TaxID=595528 RepID=A0A0D2VZ78_CAPO3|nr:hypothetical protein CAOG_07558 [Capsaspora owczarzaki ATCC 30864]KJE97087.1 hypothetical protein CAOG_007558 [Capsaspora owczarzaki ATCC 30864]|eukprot:XP_004343432.2 hypothetical protein CAOG_07558 [Capsaspora owczarzaki ATCC 30864]
MMEDDDFGLLHQHAAGSGVSVSVLDPTVDNEDDDDNNNSSGAHGYGIHNGAAAAAATAGREQQAQQPMSTTTASTLTGAGNEHHQGFLFNPTESGAAMGGEEDNLDDIFGDDDAADALASFSGAAGGAASGDRQQAASTSFAGFELALDNPDQDEDEDEDEDGDNRRASSSSKKSNKKKDRDSDKSSKKDKSKSNKATGKEKKRGKAAKAVVSGDEDDEVAAEAAALHREAGKDADNLGPRRNKQKRSFADSVASDGPAASSVPRQDAEDESDPDDAVTDQSSQDGARKKARADKPSKTRSEASFESAPKSRGAFDEIMERMKAKRVKPEKFDKFSDERLQEIKAGVRAFVDKMQRAARDDKAAREKRMPGLSKLKMLADVDSELRKVQLHEMFMECGILAAIAEWLRPLPDGSLPTESIRTKLLTLLDLMNLADMDEDLQDALQSSELGKIVFILKVHKDETQQNKRIAKTLIDKWSRSLFNLEAAHADQEKQSVVLSESDLARRHREQAENVLAAAPEAGRQHARLPQPSTREYLVRPRVAADAPTSATTEVQDAASEAVLAAFSRRIQASKSKTSKSRQQAVGGIVESKHCIM